MFTTPINKTTRRSIKRSVSPNSSPEQVDEQSFDRSLDDTSTRIVGTRRGDEGCDLEEMGDEMMMTTMGRDGRNEASFNMLTQRKQSTHTLPDQPSSRPPHSSSATKDEQDPTPINSLITKMERTMRIVSSTSTSTSPSTSTTTNRPRKSEAEVNEVEGVLGQVCQVGRSVSGGMGQDQRGSGLEQGGGVILSGGSSKPLRSLRQPAIQPRMNKSTLARLNPSTPTMALKVNPTSSTTTRNEDRTSRRTVGGVRVGVEVEVGGSKRRSMVVTPTSLRPPVITPRSTRSSDLRATMIKDPHYLSPMVDTPSTSLLSRMTNEEIKAREARIFEGTPGHKRELGLGDELWSLRRAPAHKSNRSADLRRDPSLAIRPVTPTREFNARPLPAMYGVGRAREKVGEDGERPRVRK